MDWLIEKFQSKLISQFLYFLAFGGGLFGFFKMILVLYSTRLFSFYWVYRHKDRFYNHKVFTLIDSLRNTEYIAIGVMDTVKKDIIADIFKIEIKQLKKTLRMILRKVFKNNITEYTSSFSDFEIKSIVYMFHIEFYNSRSLVELVARSRFTNYGGMTHDDFNKFWKLYCEIMQDYELVIMESLHKYKNHKDIYQAMFFMLDDFLMLVEIMYKSFAGKFNRLNGRSNGIVYKGGAIGDSDK